MAIFYDTHVHCYKFQNLSTLLDHAWNNFVAASSASQGDEMVLFFTDGNTDKTWHTLNDHLEDSHRFGDWQAQPTQGLIHMERTIDGAGLWLAPARQINSKERLEFLLLGCSQDIEDGIPAEQIIQDYSSDYVTICPWGVGKWLGTRGKLLENLVDQHGQLFYLGDNGGRPWFWGANNHFNRSPLPLINGSDPLPIKGELHRVGSIGVCIQTQVKVNSLAQLISLVKLDEAQKTSFGKPMGLSPFVKKRIQMARR